MSAQLPADQPTTDEVEAGLNAISEWDYDGEVDQLRTLYANALDRDQGIDEERFAKTSSLGGFPVQKTAWWKRVDPEPCWEVSSRSSAWAKSALDPQAVFQELAAERAKMHERLQRTGGHMGSVSGFVIPTRERIGLFSERIEGHSRERIAANCGVKRANEMRPENGLPDDLEAWVEEGVA